MNKVVYPALLVCVISMGLSGCILEADSGTNPGVPGSGGNGNGGNGGGDGGGDGGDGSAAGECLNRLNDSDGTVAATVGAGCIGCDVVDEANVLTADEDDLAVLSTALSLLPVGGVSSVAIDVTLNGSRAGADTNPGFIVSFSDVSGLSLGVLPSLSIATTSAGTVVDSESYPFGILQDSVALGALGVLDINNAQVFVGVPATTDYDGLRIELGGVVANALLDINVHGACTDGNSGSLAGDSPL